MNCICAFTVGECKRLLSKQKSDIDYPVLFLERVEMGGFARRNGCLYKSWKIQFRVLMSVPNPCTAADEENALDITDRYSDLIATYLLTGSEDCSTAKGCPWPGEFKVSRGQAVCQWTSDNLWGWRYTVDYEQEVGKCGEANTMAPAKPDWFAPEFYWKANPDGVCVGLCDLGIPGIVDALDIEKKWMVSREKNGDVKFKRKKTTMVDLGTCVPKNKRLIDAIFIPIDEFKSPKHKRFRPIEIVVAMSYTDENGSECTTCANVVIERCAGSGKSEPLKIEF